LDKQHTKEQINLIALWAFCESGLGGILHAIKLPFTGFFVGGFACIILMLLAEQFKHKPYQTLKATILVMSIKFMVSQSVWQNNSINSLAQPTPASVWGFNARPSWKKEIILKHFKPYFAFGGL
jgi:hypothetical protein